MCLAKAYLKEQGGEPLMEDIAYMELDGRTIRMETMFGEEKVISGRILEVDFEDSKIIIAPYIKKAER
jgi:predicted RNA-binding protein